MMSLCPDGGWHLKLDWEKILEVVIYWGPLFNASSENVQVSIFEDQFNFFEVCLSMFNWVKKIVSPRELLQIDYNFMFHYA